MTAYYLTTLTPYRVIQTMISPPTIMTAPTTLVVTRAFNPPASNVKSTVPVIPRKIIASPARKTMAPITRPVVEYRDCARTICSIIWGGSLGSSLTCWILYCLAPSVGSDILFTVLAVGYPGELTLVRRCTTADRRRRYVWDVHPYKDRARHSLESRYRCESRFEGADQHNAGI